MTTNETKRFRKWLLPVLAEWGMVFLLFTIGYALNHWLIWVLVCVLLGSRQHALGILGHDGAHYLCAQNRRLNDLATQWLCFWPLWVGIRGYRKFHFRHHRYVGDDLDPERNHYNHWSRSQWTLPRTRRQLLLTFLLDLAGGGLREVIKAQVLIGRIGWWDWVGPLLWWAVVGAVLCSSGLWLTAVIWIVAMFTSFWASFRLRIWTEHIGINSTYRISANWWQRLFITPHNTWYHYEHHENPNVPFWRLPHLRDAKERTVRIGELYASYAAVPPSKKPT